MRQVNWTALNVRLCERLEVPHSEECRCNSCCRTTRERAFAFVEYPNLLSVDALMPLLAARGEEHFSHWRSRWYQKHQGIGVSTADNHEWWAGLGLAPARGHGADTPGHALALAAAAALGVEVPYAE